MIYGQQNPVNHDSRTAKVEVLAIAKDRHFGVRSLCSL
jgi:hypothetical protein